jgi:hypothetical protein
MNTEKTKQPNKTNINTTEVNAQIEELIKKYPQKTNISPQEIQRNIIQTYFDRNDKK